MNNNQKGNFYNNSNNGEGTPSSLSAVTGGNRTNINNEQMANIHKQRAATPTGKRAEDYKKSGGLSSTNGSGNSARRYSTNRNNFKQNVNNLKQAVAKEAIKKYAAAYGIPEGVSEKLLNTKTGQKMLERGLNQKTPIAGIGDLAKKAGNAIKPDYEKTVDEKSDEREQKKISSGEIDFEFSLKTIKWIVILSPIISSIILFFLVILVAVSDEKVSSMILSTLVTETSKDTLESMHDEFGNGSSDQTGNGSSSLALGKASSKYPKEYYDRLAALGNNYSMQSKCKGKECLTRSEFLYYLKIADISLRYKNKYNVNLDWYLISATNLYFSKSTETIMEANLGGYNKDNVENYSIMSGLDWDNDYKNMSGYQYLDADDSTYDLQILAKNMVKKKTIQTCTDQSGNVVKKQEDEDIEDKYFAAGGNKRLNCGSGQTYNINSTYTKDMDKFDEFMLEYIDHKLNKSGSGKKGNSSSIANNSLADAFVNLAVSQLNDPEGANGQKYWSWFGFNSRIEWCATFVSWCIANTNFGGEALKDIIQKKTASVYEFMDYFDKSTDPNINFKYNDNCSKYSGKNGTGSTYTPKRGDLIFFDWDESWNGLPACYNCGQDHVGIVQGVEGGNVITIEGNSSNAVKERSYPLNSCTVIGFGSWY